MIDYFEARCGEFLLKKEKNREESGIYYISAVLGNNHPRGKMLLSKINTFVTHLFRYRVSLPRFSGIPGAREVPFLRLQSARVRLTSSGLNQRPSLLTVVYFEDNEEDVGTLGRRKNRVREGEIRERGEWQINSLLDFREIQIFISRLRRGWISAHHRRRTEVKNLTEIPIFSGR